MGIVRVLRDAVTGKTPDPPPRPDPKGCEACGLVFASESAWRVHLEDMPGGRTRCMPPGRLEGALLTRADGVWCITGSDAARG